MCLYCCILLQLCSEHYTVFSSNFKYKTERNLFEFSPLFALKVTRKRSLRTEKVPRKIDSTEVALVGVGRGAASRANKEKNYREPEDRPLSRARTSSNRNRVTRVYGEALHRTDWKTFLSSSGRVNELKGELSVPIYTYITVGTGEREARRTQRERETEPQSV